MGRSARRSTGRTGINCVVIRLCIEESNVDALLYTKISTICAGSEPVRVGDGHSGVKGSRIAWMGDLDKLATTGFSKMSDRQVGIWETGGLNNVKTIVIDQSAGVIMPFWTDNNILFLGMCAVSLHCRH